MSRHPPPNPPLITVALALIRRGGRYLISRRRADQHLGRLWEFPGGKCEAGETSAECAVREALEEVGVVCRAASTLPEIVHAYPERTVRLVPVLCDHLSGAGENLLVEEHRWVTTAELRDYVFPEANAALVAILLSQDEEIRGAG